MLSAGAALPVEARGPAPAGGASRSQVPTPRGFGLSPAELTPCTPVASGGRRPATPQELRTTPIRGGSSSLKYTGEGAASATTVTRGRWTTEPHDRPQDAINPLPEMAP